MKKILTDVGYDFSGNVFRLIKENNKEVNKLVTDGNPISIIGNNTIYKLKKLNFTMHYDNFKFLNVIL